MCNRRCTHIVPEIQWKEVPGSQHWYFLYIWLPLVLVAACKLLVVACGILFPDQGWNPGHLHWELRVLTTGPPGKSQEASIWLSVENGLGTSPSVKTC